MSRPDRFSDAWLREYVKSNGMERLVNAGDPVAAYPARCENAETAKLMAELFRAWESYDKALGRLEVHLIDATEC